MVKRSNFFSSNLEDASKRKEIIERTKDYRKLILQACIDSNIDSDSMTAMYLCDILKHVVKEISGTDVIVGKQLSCVEIAIPDEEGYHHNTKLFCRGSVLYIPYVRLPECLQNKGIFSRFIDMVIDVAKNYNIDVIEIDTVANPNLRHALEKRDFKLVAITNPYLPDSVVEETDKFVKPYDMVRIIS